MENSKNRSRGIRIGWFDLNEGWIAEIAPATDGYAVCLIAPRTLDALANSEWADVISLSPCIVNTGYDTDIGDIKPISEIDEVSWSDETKPTHLAENFLQARRHLSKILSKDNGNSRILIDATSISKSMLSAITGMLIRTRAVSNIDIIYQQVDYTYLGRNLEDVYAEGPFSHGINDIQFSLSAIPYVEGKYKPGMRRHVILLAGLDFQRTLFKLRELEPAEIDVIVESEAIADPQNAAALKRMCHHLEIEDNRIFSTNRIDVIDSLGLINSALSRKEVQDLHSIIVSSGGKPFSLSGTIQSILRSECPMLCTIPDKVVHLNKKRNKPFRLYRLIDRTALI